MRHTLSWDRKKKSAVSPKLGREKKMFKFNLVTSYIN